jgi:hypothetical protein
MHAYRPTPASRAALQAWLRAQPEPLDKASNLEDAPAIPMGVSMRYKVGAERLQQVPSLVHRADGVFRVARTAPAGPTHAVCAVTGATICGIKTESLEVLNEDWEAACFVEKCAACFAAVLARGPG